MNEWPPIPSNHGFVTWSLSVFCWRGSAVCFPSESLRAPLAFITVHTRGRVNRIFSVYDVFFKDNDGKIWKQSAQVLYRVMHALQKGNDTVSKPNFAVQIIEMSVSFGFTLCAFPRGAVGITRRGNVTILSVKSWSRHAPCSGMTNISTALAQTPAVVW